MRVAVSSDVQNCEWAHSLKDIFYYFFNFIIFCFDQIYLPNTLQMYTIFGMAPVPFFCFCVGAWRCGTIYRNAGLSIAAAGLQQKFFVFCLGIMLYAGLKSFVSGIQAGEGLFFSRVTAQSKALGLDIIYIAFRLFGVTAGDILTKNPPSWNMIGRKDKDDGWC